MSSVNKAILIGRLGADPEIRYTQANKPIVSVSLATSESWKDKQSGNRQERTEWHRVVFFDRLAEVVGEYLQKGSLVYVEGKLQTRKYQDQNGQDRYTTEIVARDMNMLGGRDNERQTTEPQRTTEQQQSEQQDVPSHQQTESQSQHSSSTDFDDDIPF